jgi:hypothetical protein
MLVISIILHRHSWEHPSHQQHPRSSLSSVRCSITLKCLCCLRAGFPGSIQFSSDTYAAAWAQMFDRFQNVCAAYVQAFLRASKLPATPTQQPELRCSIVFSNVYAAYAQVFLGASKSVVTPTQQPGLRCSIVFKMSVLLTCRHSWEHPSHQQHPRSSLSSDVQSFSNVYAAYAQVFLGASKSVVTPTQQPWLRCFQMSMLLTCRHF